MHSSKAQKQNTGNTGNTGNTEKKNTKTNANKPAPPPRTQRNMLMDELLYFSFLLSALVYAAHVLLADQDYSCVDDYDNGYGYDNGYAPVYEADTELDDEDSDEADSDEADSFEEQRYWCRKTLKPPRSPTPPRAADVRRWEDRQEELRRVKYMTYRALMEQAKQTEQAKRAWVKPRAKRPAVATAPPSPVKQPRPRALRARL